MSIITIVGAGMMGSAIGFPASDNGNEVRLVGTPLDREIIRHARKTGETPDPPAQTPHGIQILPGRGTPRGARRPPIYW